MPNEVSRDEIISALEQAVKLGAKSVLFTGGEIFLRPDLTEVIKWIVSKGCKVTFETNGTLLTKNKVKALLDIDSTMAFAVSLDGITAETHERFRAVPGCFTLTMKGIRELNDAGASLQILTVINRLNVNELPDLIEFVQNDLRSLNRFLVMDVAGRAWDNRDLTLSAYELHALLQDLIFPWMRRTKKVHVDIPVALIPPEFETICLCQSGLTMMGMSQDGYLGLCSRINDSPELSSGHIRTDSVETVWKSALFDKMRNVSHKNLKGICGNCIAAYICRGRCRANAFYESGGDFYAPNSICQGFYDAGLFPRYAMIDFEQDSHYDFERQSNPATQMIKSDAT